MDMELKGNRVVKPASVIGPTKKKMDTRARKPNVTTRGLK